MSNVLSMAKLLNDEINRIGESEISIPTSLFSGAPTGKPVLHSIIGNKKFRVFTFEYSDKEGISSPSIHFTIDISSESFDVSQIACWNADNRFTKIYQQEDETLLVMDQFISDTELDTVQSCIAMWIFALNELSRFKFIYDRKHHIA